jgi:hypothetical protein
MAGQPTKYAGRPLTSSGSQDGEAGAEHIWSFSASAVTLVICAIETIRPKLDCWFGPPPTRTSSSEHTSTLHTPANRKVTIPRVASCDSAIWRVEARGMTRTKWMRLGVRDLADILRWAGEQNIRHLDNFRHRVIHGREFVSFRMVPRYAIEIGTADIIVVAHVHAGARQRLSAACSGLGRYGARLIARNIARLTRPTTAPARPQTAELFELPARRVSAPSRH